MIKVMELPKLGVNMEKAKIVEWIARVGDQVELDQDILTAETDKAVVDIPAIVSGVLAVQVAQVGETIKCGEPIAVFTEPGEELPADFSLDLAASSAAEAPPAPTPVRAAAETPTSDSAVAASASQGGRVIISPRGRKTAKEMNIDFSKVPPANRGARITKADVLAYAEGLKQTPSAAAQVSSAAPLPVDVSLTVKECIPLEGIRGTIAKRLWKSSQATAQAVLFAKVDLTGMTDWRADLKAQGHAVSINSLMVAVVAKALSEFPGFNARIEGQEIQLIEEINIGVAVDTARGLLVPIIRRADKRGVIAIDVDFKEKVDRTKSGKSTLEDLSGGTFTITNLGMFGVEAFIPIINPPEAAILALGGVNRQQVVMDDDSVAVKPMIWLSLVWDHRINDGAPAARFLGRIKQIMEWPMALMS